MKFKIRQYLKNAFAKGTTINDYNLKALVFVGSLGHPLFAFMHLYIFKMPWDNFALKFSAGLVCLLLATKDYWPRRIKPLFPLYWHFMLIYNLPFLVGLTALNNNFIKTWFLWELIMLYILIMFVPHWLIFLIDLAIGTLLALLCHSVIYGKTIIGPVLFSLNSGLDLFLYLLTFGFAIISGLIFSYSNAKGAAAEERAKIFKSLAGSIAHELRNPLNTINLIGNQINELLTKKQPESIISPSTVIVPSAKAQLLDLTSNISDAVSGANNIINIILSDLSEKSLTEDDFSYLKPSEILPQILNKYGYKNENERSKVKLLLSGQDEDNQIFKAISDRFTFIIYNLLKNALHYLNQYPESVVTVGNERREIEGKEYNIIYVHDTGPGILPHIIPKLFDDFYTSGKKEGTGLGLAFCKRNMKIFGGDIICESEFGKWTKFSLLFPTLSEEEITSAKIEAKKKKILLVDGKEINLITTKSKIEKILLHIHCDIAMCAKEAVNMAKENRYHLVLMDIQMPEIGGIETAKEIRTYNQGVPIIALTSLSKDLFLKEIEENAEGNDFNYYLNKSSADNILYRSLNKWIIDLEDDLSYLGTKEECLKILKGKKVILADDQQLNRIVTRKVLESCGLKVTEANDGRELLEIYQESLDSNGNSDFDIIVTDINMPPYNGDEAAQAIRKIEASYDTSPQDEMPIIALSGNGEKEDIYHYFNCQMTDYFIKGQNPELLLKIMANYLARKNDDPSNDYLSEFKIFNQNALDYFNKEDREKLLNLFLKDSFDTISKIKEKEKTGDIKQLLFYIHSLKGTSASMGAERLSYYLKRTEPIIRNGSLPENWMEEFEMVCLELVKEISSLLNN